MTYLVTLDPKVTRTSVRSRLGRTEVRAPNEAEAARRLVDLVLEV